MVVVVVVGGGCGFVDCGLWVVGVCSSPVDCCVVCVGGGGEKEKAEGLKLNEENDLSVGRVL